MRTAIRVRGVVVVAAVVSSLLGGLPVAPAGAEGELRVSASVAGGPFLVGGEEPIPVTMTVTNGGIEERRLWGRVSNVEGSPFHVEGAGWRDLDPYGDGAVFAPGETRTYDLIGHVTEWAGQPRIRIGVWRPTPNIPEIAETELTFEVVPGDLTDTVGGLVFTDANENSVADPGEELAGLTVRLAKDYSPIREAVSGADGRFSFADVPVGFYQLLYEPLPDGWLLPYSVSVRADGTGSAADVMVRARRPISESLRASVALDRKIYTAGSPARLTVTLTNSGRRPLTGLRAGCDRLGTLFHLLVTQEAWGELAYEGPGATVQPGQTRTFSVAGTVPEHAVAFGVLSVVCDVGDDDLYLDGAADAPPLYTKVRSNKTADTEGVVFHDRDDDYVVDDGEAVTNTRIGLRNVTTGRVTADATTDAAGYVTYTDVPVGRYHAEIFGPWAPLNGVIAIASDPYTVPFGTLRVSPTDGTSGTQQPAVRSTVTGQDGQPGA
ncbi:hypothetical protein [Actinophytocola algeriensis]|uniref:Uncharacterized protein n=1 Tax=Actinophytocola algeriensis TaxID=1768010 RepID=A0A7W7QF57_9PSEU|nr:hypothetical protein [Actinophytocola algeriensis]MBB4912308.1 hypothetical protein [Actinophytocola algeriensis]MBE1474176.1 hypothetical protein [Actinophytocola algeriensis]